MIQARLRKNFPAGRESAAFTLDVQFESGAGITALFGPSGSGKTLTLDCLAGFVRPEEGRILVDDRLLFDSGTHVHIAPQHRRCGYVFQNYALFPHMTLRQNLMFAAERWPRLERHRRVTEMVEKFRLTDVAGRKPHEVSGGQKQRCSIARALIGEPRLLLLDEPARGLDAPLREELYTILRQVRNDFATPVLLVTHNLDECFALADEMLVIRDGRLIQSGKPAEVCERPANLEFARLLGIYNILPVEVRALDPSRNTSTLRYDEWEISGPYFPGRLRGDRVHLLVAPEQLRAIPRPAVLGRNQVPVRLDRVVGMPESIRLEFNGISVVMPRDELEPQKDNKEWVVDFSRAALRII